MRKNNVFEYIVVGSGCTGAQSAQTLVEKGKEVLLLDVGNKDDSNIEFPKEDFLKIRKNELNQQNLFLGKDYSGIPIGQMKPGYHLTPSRKHVIKDVNKLMPVSSETFQPFESLAIGGLGAAWGTGSYIFNETELKKCGLDPKEIKPCYELMFKRIGITKGNESCDFNEEESLDTDKSINKIVKRFNKYKKFFNKENISLTRTPLAVISKDRSERKGYKYKDMDFWHDDDKSAYRPWITIFQLKKHKNFKYIDNLLVTRFEELENKIKITCVNSKTEEKEVYYCKKLLLGASVFSTARIVLRSLNKFNIKVKFLCNSYYYIPTINLSMLGKLNSKKKIGFSQLTMLIKNNGDTEVANFFTYRSLLLFKLIKESPLSIKISRLIFKFLQSSLVILGFHISKSFNENDYLTLNKDSESITKDRLYFYSGQDKTELKNEKKILKKLQKALIKLWCIPIKKIKTPDGSSIHYAGTLPFSKENKPLTTSFSGKLNGTKNVYIIDASTFKFLPARGVTLTAMANSHRVTLKCMKDE